MSESPHLSSEAVWKFHQNPSNGVDGLGSRDLVMAWAIDKDNHHPRYILELSEYQRGAKCNCICVSCRLPLTAINAAKAEYIQRPHFRHPEGAERKSCFVLAARFAIALQLLEQGLVELPRRRRSSVVAGLSGEFHEAWIELPPERVRIVDFHFDDVATALLTLDDGRQLIVELTGGVSQEQDSLANVHPTISLNIADSAIAGMSPEEIRKRLTLLWAGACWKSHWDDIKLLASATSAAKQKAVEAMDWLEEENPGDLDGFSNEQRRETLLHREVKAILEREKRINLPELVIQVNRLAPRRDPFKRETTWPSMYVGLEEVYLEKRLGRVIPA